jgi:hypothetical protein
VKNDKEPGHLHPGPIEKEVRDLKRYLLAMLLACLVLVATAAPAFAQGRPAIGGAPPGDGSSNEKAGDNPGTDNRAAPRTGGQSVHFGLND